MDDLLSKAVAWATVAALLSPIATFFCGFFLVDKWRDVRLSCVPGTVAAIGWLATGIVDGWISNDPWNFASDPVVLITVLIPAIFAALAAAAAAAGWMLRRRIFPRQRIS